MRPTLDTTREEKLAIGNQELPSRFRGASPKFQPKIAPAITNPFDGSVCKPKLLGPDTSAPYFCSHSQSDGTLSSIHFLSEQWCSFHKFILQPNAHSEISAGKLCHVINQFIDDLIGIFRRSGGKDEFAARVSVSFDAGSTLFSFREHSKYTTFRHDHPEDRTDLFENFEAHLSLCNRLPKRNVGGNLINRTPKTEAATEVLPFSVPGIVTTRTVIDTVVTYVANAPAYICASFSCPASTNLVGSNELQKELENYYDLLFPNGAGHPPIQAGNYWIVAATSTDAATQRVVSDCVGINRDGDAFIYADVTGGVCLHKLEHVFRTFIDLHSKIFGAPIMAFTSLIGKRSSTIELKYHDKLIGSVYFSGERFDSRTIEVTVGSEMTPLVDLLDACGFLGNAKAEQLFQISHALKVPLAKTSDISRWLTSFDGRWFTRKDHGRGDHYLFGRPKEWSPADDWDRKTEFKKWRSSYLAERSISPISPTQEQRLDLSSSTQADIF